MNKDIFFLANSEILHKSKKNKIIELLDIFIDEEKTNIISHFTNCVENRIFDNQYIKDFFYKYITEYKCVLDSEMETQDTNIESNYSNKELMILNDGFLKFKQNRQKSIMESFQQKKTINLVEKNNSISYHKVSKSDNTTSKKPQKRNKKTGNMKINEKKESTDNNPEIHGKTLDLTNKI